MAWLHRALCVRAAAGFSVAILGCRSAAPRSEQTTAATYTVDAIRYGTLPAFRVRNLVAGADSSRRMDIALMVWLLRSRDRVVLVDAGFHREKFLRQWKPVDFVRPSDAVLAAGIQPVAVTDIVLSHIHWDHMDGLDLFPRARVWVQRAEYEYYVGERGEVLHAGIDPVDAAMLAELRAAGRVMLVEGDAREVLPGIIVYTGGRHTYASQYVGVRTPAGTAVIASDNLYLYENLDRRAPIAQTLDAASNLAAQTRMLDLASHRRLIVPGHDPAVFERFPNPGRGVARIE